MADTQLFTSEGKFLMLALDHRESFRKLMNRNTPASVGDREIIKLKSSIIESVIDQVSGVLVDPQWGLKAYRNRTKPFLLPVEKSGYKEVNGERITELQHSVKELIDLGASGAKLLLYFNPKLPSAYTQRAIARKVLDECKRLNVPFFLEIITYRDELSSALHLEGVKLNRAGLVLGSLEALIDNGIIPDVFKLEYAGSFASCQKVTEILGQTRWILLSRGDTFDVFKQELEEAVRAGAKGFLAGRALWQEACGMSGEDRDQFLRETLPERFETIAEIARMNQEL